jgi:hypothetical protein
MSDCTCGVDWHPQDHEVHCPIQQRDVKRVQLRKKIEEVINSVSAENGSDTPDWILAEFLTGCLEAFDKATNARTEYYAP